MTDEATFPPHTHAGEILRRCSDMERKMDKLMTNDLAHLSSDLNTVKVLMAKLEADVGWLKNALWAVVGPTLAALGVGILNLLSK